jgi:peptidoglycan hydrolase-like protein with peptidoglycan-binding domain
MSRSARRREPEIGLAGRLAGGLALSGAALARNPVLVGGTTAFLVTMFYVSANAIWYQPGSHRDAVFATRPFLASGGAEEVAAPTETLIRLERESELPEPTPRPSKAAGEVEASAPDPVMTQVQQELARLGLYAGDVDGLDGPRTRQAIADYEEKIGLPQTGVLNNRMITELLGRPPMAKPADLPEVPPLDDAALQTASVVSAGDPVVSQVQAGMRAFGNDQIEIDGRMGPATSAAIREFQTLFGLKPSGEIDDALIEKMREVGLTN